MGVKDTMEQVQMAEALAHIVKEHKLANITVGDISITNGPFMPDFPVLEQESDEDDEGY